MQQYLLHEIQTVYRAQRVVIDDKHIELVVSQMLRKVKVEDVGDTPLLPGLLYSYNLTFINEATNVSSNLRLENLLVDKPGREEGGET